VYGLSLDAEVHPRWPQQAPDWIGGQGTDPYEQKTQQSPVFGFNRRPHPLQS
jgi:hypothetical protein